MKEEEQVILVNKDDDEVGQMEKLEAHQKGALHRALSIFIFNSKGELLLQQRSNHKYHSGGLWTNTCCSHPRPGEDVKAAALRRLQEEMGMEAPLDFKCTFVYRAEFTNGLIEHEVDHIFTGTSDQAPVINKEEVMDYRWQTLENIKEELRRNPGEFTYWFRIAVNDLF